MTKSFYFSTLILTGALLADLSLQAQVKVHPFEQPPRLKEAIAAGSRTANFALKSPGTQNCEPQGSLTRNGNVVSATLNFVRANFTINNPDPVDPYGGEDPVTLRSYGGCKSGPVIEVFPGNTLKLNLINGLTKDDPS